MSVTFHLKTYLGDSKTHLGPPPGRSNKGRNICAFCGYRVDDAKDEKRRLLFFPKPYAVQYTQWLNAVSDDHVLSAQSRVCSEHFSPDDFLKPFKRGDKWILKLKSGAVPSLLLPEKRNTSVAEDSQHVAKGVTAPTKRKRTPLQPHCNVKLNPPQKQHSAGSHRHPILFPVEVVFCPLCAIWKQEPCWLHTTTVPDQAVLPYAVASLPQVLYLGTSTDISQVKAIFAKSCLQPQTVFGPLIGALVDPTPGSKYALKEPSDQKIRHLDLENDKLANWMKFVRFAENIKEQNVAVYFRDEKLYFVTTRNIQLKEELKVGYSSKYAFVFGFSLLTAYAENENCDSDEDASMDESLVMDTNCGPSQRQNLPTPLRTIHENDKIDTLPPLEPLLPGCLPTNEDSPVDSIFHDPLDILFYPEVNFLPCGDDTENQPDETAEELCMAVDPAVETDPTVVQETVVHDGSNPMLPSVEGPLTSPIITHIFHFDAGPYPARPKPRLLSPDDDSTDSDDTDDSTLVDSKPAAVKVPRRRRRKAYPQPQLTGCKLCGKWRNGRLMPLPQSSHYHMWKYHRDHCNEHWEYQCTVCSVKFPTKIGLTGHMSRGHPRPVTVISRDSQAVQDAMQHVRTSGYLTYCCRSCQRHYLNKAIFDLHKLRHRTKDSLEDRPERCCPCCSYIAESFEDLMEHTITHSQDSDNKLCIFCGQRAPDMRYHMKKYHSEIMDEATKDWKFECDECDDHRFSRENLLLQHKRLHNDAALGFQCLYCAKVTAGCDFGTHSAEHKINGVFKCPCCERTFLKYPLMRIHYRDMHDIKSIKTCDICHEVFRNPLKLKFHMKKVHVTDNREEGLVQNRTDSKKTRESREMGTEDDENASEDEDAEVHPKRFRKGKKNKRP